MQNKGKMFDNPVLEFLSRSNPFVIVFLHLVIILSLLLYGIRAFRLPFLFQIFLFVTGLFFWTLAEYLIHRFVFHWKSEHKLLKAIHYALHGHHHENPGDKNHLFMPPIPVIIIAFILFTFFYLLFGKHAFYFFPGFELGYLLYSMIHYSVHVKPYSKGFMKKLWVHHGKHHYYDPDSRFGVSNTIWDKVFRTIQKEK